MSKVFGMHMIALKPGVKAEDFERFVTEEVYPLPSPEGSESYLLRGDRGDREGKYLVMYEFESVEARDRFFPSPGEMSKEAQQVFEPWAAAMEKWATLATPMDSIYTDYVSVGK
ncbi:MAG: hypothetical protein PVI09_09790 [Anaerolineae bacterium]|jgi:hypothetical protein